MKPDSLALSLAATVLLCAPAWAQDTAAPPAEVPPAQAPTTAAPGAVRLPMGTLVDIELVDTVSTKTAKQGDFFAIRLASPIKIDGVVVVPAGATGQGQVVDVGKPGMGGKPGVLVVAARYVDFNGQRIPLKAFKLSGAGANNTDTAMIASMAFTPAGFIIKGGEVVFPAGVRASAKIGQDVDLPAPSPAG